MSTQETSKKTWTLSDSYELYKEEVGDLAIDRKLYLKAFKEIFWELSKSIIQERLTIKFPYRLGFFSIRKRKNNKNREKQRIDYKYYNETGKIKYHNNLHSNQYHFFWDWDVYNTYANFTNKSFYKFIANRGNDYIIGKRGLKAWILKCSEDPMVRDYDVLTKT